MTMTYTGIELARKQTKEIARDFKYKQVMPNIYKRIKQAKTEDELSNILTTCRKRKVW